MCLPTKAYMQNVLVHGCQCPRTILSIPLCPVHCRCRCRCRCQVDMALVEYSDSEPDEEDAVCRQSPPLPALPAAFHDLYASNARISVRDVSSLHGGRKRAIPHVEGNWPTHIYLECKSARWMSALCLSLSLSFSYMVLFSAASRVSLKERVCCAEPARLGCAERLQ